MNQDFPPLPCPHIVSHRITSRLQDKAHQSQSAGKRMLILFYNKSHRTTYHMSILLQEPVEHETVAVVRIRCNSTKRHHFDAAV